MLSPVVETAIGMVFVYLLLSMICSALQEWIAAFLALRASTLYEGITEMLCGDNDLRDKIFRHPLVNGLSRKSIWDRLFNRAARPSYISADTFAKAFVAETNLSQLNAQLADPKFPTPDLTHLHSNTRVLVKTLIEAAPGDINTLRHNIEAWYNEAMDRVSGWYKRRTQWVIVILGFCVALFFNADTIMLARTFWGDPTLRANTVAAAVEYVRTHDQPINAQTSPAKSSPGMAQPAKGSNNEKSKQPDISDQYPSVTSGDTAGGAPPPEQPYTQEQKDRAEQEYRDARARLQSTSADVVAQLNAVKVPLGWCRGTESDEPEESPEPDTQCDADHRIPPEGIKAILLKLSGLLVTTIALSQGAPFWFDLLRKVVNLRLAGDAPDEKQNKK